MNRPIKVVDIGASSVDGPPVYRPLLAAGLCEVVGFEPQPEWLEKLNAAKGPHETYLPHVIGDGTEQTLHVCVAPGMTSLLEPDRETLHYVHGFTDRSPERSDGAGWADVVQTASVQTTPLGSALGPGADVDLIKMDVQGTEAMIIGAAPEVFARAVAVHVEVSFVPQYRGAPHFADIDIALRALGFVLHAFVQPQSRALVPTKAPGGIFGGFNQILWSDAVYVKDWRRLGELPVEKLQALKTIAEMYGSPDLAALCHAAARPRLVEVPVETAPAPTAIVSVLPQREVFIERPKVMWACPQGKVMDAKVHGNHMSMLFENTKVDKAFVTGFYQTVGLYVGLARANIAKAALHEWRTTRGVTHLLWVDDDMILEPDTIERLCRRNLPIVSATYYRRDDATPLALVRHPTNRSIWQWVNKIPNTGLLKIDGIGLGCCLMRIELLDRLEKTYGPSSSFQTAIEQEGCAEKPEGYFVGEDLFFSRRIRDMGVDIYIDLDAPVGHMTSDPVTRAHYEAIHGSDWQAPDAPDVPKEIAASSSAA